ncbi:MAG: ribonuclease H-like domain-containing protein [Candidatus Paceibacterota bacterium]
MTQDKIVIDIETKNTFADVGQDNFDALEVSLVGVYSYLQDKFFCFKEHQLTEFGKMFKNAESIIGFSINRFDVPVLKKHFNFDIYSVPRFDILDEIELLLGQRIGLDLLARVNLGKGKNGHGLEAANLYRDGKMEELKNYCLNDVKITKELYDLAKNRGYLLVPQKRSDQMLKAEFNWSESLI